MNMNDSSSSHSSSSHDHHEVGGTSLQSGERPRTRAKPRCIVVMGGSFNPPTVAHFELLRAAVDACGADQGVFVPTSHQYVSAKMRRQGGIREVLSESIRLQMLDTFCQRDDRLAVSTLQMEGRLYACDYEILVAIKAQNPAAEIYFLVGSDKLEILPRWRRKTELLEHFRILVARRGSDDLNQYRRSSGFLSYYWSRFSFFDIPESIRDISSSAFRERLRRGDPSARELVTPEVWQILRDYHRIP